MTPRDVIVAAMGTANGKAWMQVVRHRESSHDDNAYFLISGGGVISSLTKYPWPNESTMRGWRAVGAGQFIPHTWYGLEEQYPKDCNNFGKYAQDFGIIALTAGRGALQDVLNGDLEAAITKCRKEWTSLPGAAENKRYTMQDAWQVFKQYGGASTTQAPAPIEDHSTQYQEETPVDPISLVAIFGSVLTQLIPQVGKLFGGKKDADNVRAIGEVLQSVVTATGQTGVPDVAKVGTAIQAMSADPAVKAKVIEAVVTNPFLVGLIEIGGGIKAAREFDIVQQQQEKPFYKTSAVFYVSIMLLPLVFWYVGASIVGGVVIPAAWPWYAQLPLMMFGLAWDAGAKVGLANLVVGMVLGGVIGVYYGVSVTQARQTAQDAKAKADAMS